MAREPHIVDKAYVPSSDPVVESSDYDTMKIQETERGLLQNTEYILRTRAINSLGVASEWSDGVEFTTIIDDSIPAQVENLIVIPDPGTGNISITWSPVTTNEDGSPLIDFAYYEVVFEDPSFYGTTGILPPFVYTSITESYTLLNSTNKALHLPINEPPARAWNIIVYATDYSGNKSEPSYFNLALEDWDVIDVALEDVYTTQSRDYSGTVVSAHDATSGWRIEADGDAEFHNLYVDGYNISQPPIWFGRQTSNNIDVYNYDNGFASFQNVPFTTQFVNQIRNVNVINSSGVWIEIKHTGWYRVTFTHRWDIPTSDTWPIGTLDTGRSAYLIKNPSYPLGTGGTSIVLGSHSGAYAVVEPLVGGTFEPHTQYTDSKIIYFEVDDLAAIRVYQNSGTTIKLITSEVTFELISF